MTHPQRNHEGKTSFTITQITLGSPLEFEPALGSQELDKLIHNYVPGSALPQQKRAQVVLEFLNSIDAGSYTHPVSIRYHVPQILTPHTMSRHSSTPSLNIPSVGAPLDDNSPEETLNTSKSTRSLKRSREEMAPLNPSSAKRMPGFSIMTRDGIDITDLASRGPKTKEQRDHAALMRKLKACAACKRSKQRCDPSHHRPVQSALSTPSSATPSNRSARLSYVSSTEGSRGSISPQSSLGESFSQSPTRSFMARAISQTGQSFAPLPPANPSLSPSDFTPRDTSLIESELSVLPMQDLNREIFQFADAEFDSWNADFTAFPPVHSTTTWSSHEDVFTPTYGYDGSSVSQSGSSLQQVRLRSLPLVAVVAEHVSPHHNDERLSSHSDQQLQGDLYPDSHEAEFDIDQWLHSTKDQNYNNSKPERAALGILCDSAGGHVDMLKHIPLQRHLENPVLSQDQDYILYPDSPHVEWGLDPHLIYRDIGNREWEWFQRREAGSEQSRNHHVNPSPYWQDSQGPDMSQVQAIFNGVNDTFAAPSRQQSWATILSSDLPGEDGHRQSSAETLTRHGLAVSQGTAQRELSSTPSRSMAALNKRMITIITLCMMMTISLLWTMSILTGFDNNSSVSPISKQGDEATLFGAETQILHMACQDNVRSISFERDHGSPSRSDSRTGLDHASSKVDSIDSGSDLTKDRGSDNLLDLRPGSETLFLADDSSTSEIYPDRRTSQPPPSPTFSNPSGTSAFTIAPSMTNYATTWMTQLSSRPTSLPKEPDVPITSQSPCQLSVQSPSARILTELKRTWRRHLNIGHLATSMTNLKIM